MTSPLWTVREEESSDIDAITKVTSAAFLSHPQSDHTEELIISELRRSNALSLSLVVEHEGRVIGHVAFSPVSISDGSLDWYGLGPLSVEPRFQGKGVGQALVKAGIEALKERGARGCVLFGSPAYYGRFGFSANPGLSYPGGPPEFFLSLKLEKASAQGEVTYHPAFGAQS
jgi:putative acetyltransferase